MEKTVKVYGYRWVVLIVFMLINAAVEIQWLTHAPVARAAEAFYAGQFDPNSLLNIDFLAMSYMLVYLVVCIPASYIIDTYGIRVGIGIGAFLAGVCGIVKGVFGADFGIVMGAQIGLAVAQPFILNGVTALTVRWFPLKERGLAAGLSSLAQYLGIIIVMGVTPLLVVSSSGDPAYGRGIDRMLLIYGIITAIAAAAALVFLRERPPTPPSQEEYNPAPFTQGLKRILSLKDMRITMLLFFIGLGIFNAVSSMVDSIAGSLGVVDSDGLIGVLMLLGGVVGALILPALSDKFLKRKLFLVLCIGGMVPGLFGLTFAGRLFADPGTAYGVALACSFILGFFVMSAGPIGFQYAAEVSAPAPESTSQGLLLLSGQITGLLFVAGMSIKNNAYLGQFMLLFFVLAAAALGLVLFLKESPLVKREREIRSGVETAAKG